MSTLKLSYQDDVLNTDVNTTRRYQLTSGVDGYQGIEEKTAFLKIGDQVGASEIKQITRKLFGFANNRIVFNPDGSITETNDSGTKTIAFNANGSITESMTDIQGNSVSQITEFKTDGSIETTIQEI
ncbi:MAG: hypothetical protein PHX08_01760 [Lachnospiraceae bacterium]|nr:hypothetical protein [Lachnospiraceae bacterium]